MPQRTKTKITDIKKILAGFNRFVLIEELSKQKGKLENTT